MKRWTSILLALCSLIAVFVGAFYTLVMSSIVFSDAASSPVYSTKISNQDTADSSYQDAKAALQTFGIELKLKPDVSFGYVSWKEADELNKNTQKAFTMLSQEWSKYTPEFIKNTGLKKIYLVTHLKVSGQERSGMPEAIFEDALYFDVSERYIASENGNYMRRTLHHEFKHLMDYNMFGKYAGDSETWKKCHISNVSYGSGGSTMYSDPEYAHTEHPEVGFVNGYATSAVEEDMAEVYAQLMTNPEKLQQLAARDSVVSCKVNATRATLAKL